MERESNLPDGTTLTAFLFVVLIGGGNFLGVKYTVQELDPFWGAGIRFLAAAAILFLIARVRRLHLPRGPALTGALVYGVLAFFAAYALAYYAIQRLTPGIAAVIMASVPLVTLFLATVQRLEAFRWRGLAGAVAAIGGIAVIAGGGGGDGLHTPSLLAALGMAVCAAESGLVLKRFPGSHPVTTNVVAMAFGAVLLLVMSALSGESLVAPNQTDTWVALVYLVVIGSVVLFILYVIGLNRWTASGMSYMFVLTPIVAVLLSAWLLDERVTLAFLIGGVLVLAGTYVGALTGHPPRAVPPGPPEEAVLEEPLTVEAIAAASQRGTC